MFIKLVHTFICWSHGNKTKTRLFSYINNHLLREFTWSQEEPFTFVMPLCLSVRSFFNNLTNITLFIMVTFPFSGYILTMLPFGCMVMLIPRIPDFFGSYSYAHVPERFLPEDFSSPFSYSSKTNENRSMFTKGFGLNCLTSILLQHQTLRPTPVCVNNYRSMPSCKLIHKLYIESKTQKNYIKLMLTPLIRINIQL